MKTITQINVRVMLRPDMAHSWHIVADMHMLDGRVVHWPKSDLGAGVLIDEEDRTGGMRRFMADLTEFLDIMP